MFKPHRRWLSVLSLGLALLAGGMLIFSSGALTADPPPHSHGGGGGGGGGAGGANQRSYLANIRANDLAFGIGPAGTGKTYLAVASAIDALETGQVRRIVLVRPAVEAGERLGFLPGDIPPRPWCSNGWRTRNAMATASTQ